MLNSDAQNKTIFVKRSNERISAHTFGTGTGGSSVDDDKNKVSYDYTFHWERSKNQAAQNIIYCALLKIVASPFSYDTHTECVQCFSVIYFKHRRLINLYTHTYNRY